MSKATELLESMNETIDKKSMQKVAKGIEALRQKFQPTSTEALLLGVFRDIAGAKVRNVSILRFISELELFDSTNGFDNE